MFGSKKVSEAAIVLFLFTMTPARAAQAAEPKSFYTKDVHLSTVRDPETGNWMLLISAGQEDLHRQNMADLSRSQILANVITPIRRAIKKAGPRVQLNQRALIDLDSVMTEYDATLLRPPSPKALQAMAAKIVRPDPSR